MTIALPAFPPLQPMIASPAHPAAGDDASPVATDFAQLLAALLAGNREFAQEPQLPDAQPDRPGKAAELAPPLGAPVEAFSAAQLLVSMAMNLAGRSSAGAAPGHHEGGIAGRTEAAVSANIHEATPNSLAPTHPQVAPPEPSAPVAPNPANPVNPAARSATGPASTTRAMSAPPIPHSHVATSQPLAQTRPDMPQRMPAARMEEATRQRPSSADPAPSSQSGRSSPFGAQLISAEGGLRLVLRLPKLADGERAGLEAALGRLLESHGHRHTAIVIHEIPEG